MKALILAAGLGSRLQHRTSDIPKALVKIAGRAILEYQIDALAENGINSVVIVVGKEGQKIVDFMGSRCPDRDVTFVWNNEYATSNSSYSFWLARELIQGERYVHLNCDIIFSPALLRKIIDSPHENVIAVRKDVTLADNMENVELAGDRIVGMSITRPPGSVGKAYGLAKFGPAGTDFIVRRIGEYLEKGDKNRHCYGIIREAVREIEYHAFDASEDVLMEVNTLSDLEEAERIMKSAI